MAATPFSSRPPPPPPDHPGCHCHKTALISPSAKNNLCGSQSKASLNILHGFCWLCHGSASLTHGRLVHKGGIPSDVIMERRDSLTSLGICKEIDGIHWVTSIYLLWNFNHDGGNLSAELSSPINTTSSPFWDICFDEKSDTLYQRYNGIFFWYPHICRMYTV